jgi:O-antigen/teichoic acid export membrane protein
MKRAAPAPTETKPNLDVGPAAASPRRTRFYRRLIDDHYVRSNTILLGANVGAGILAYLLHPVLGRMMGVRAYGQVAALIALSLVLLTPTQLVATVAARYAASMAVTRSFAKLNDFVRRFTVILLPCGFAVAATFAGVSTYVAHFFHLGSRQGVILLSLLFVVSCVTPLNLGTVQGLERFGWYAVITLLSALLRLAAPVSLVFFGLGVNGAMLGIALGGIAAYLVSFRPLEDVLRGPREPMESVRPVWAFALFAGGAAAGMVALFSVDIVLARHYLDAKDAGVYAALATIGRTALFVTSSVTVVMFPKVVALYERKQRHAHVAVQALLGAVALAGAAEAAFAVAPTLVVRLLFGHAFEGLAGTLPLYGLAMLLLAAAQVLVAYLLALGRRSVVPIVFSAFVLEAGLIVWRHETIRELARAVLVADAALLLALLVAAFPPSLRHRGMP